MSSRTNDAIMIAIGAVIGGAYAWWQLANTTYEPMVRFTTSTLG